MCTGTQAGLGWLPRRLRQSLLPHPCLPLLHLRLTDSLLRLQRHLLLCLLRWLLKSGGASPVTKDRLLRGNLCRKPVLLKRKR